MASAGLSECTYDRDVVVLKLGSLPTTACNPVHRPFYSLSWYVQSGMNGCNNLKKYCESLESGEAVFAIVHFTLVFDHLETNHPDCTFNARTPTAMCSPLVRVQSTLSFHNYDM